MNAPVPAGECDLDALAADVRMELDGLRSSFKRGLEHAFNVGDLLIKAKARPELPHGAWLPWFQKAGLNERMAQRYMRLSRSRGQLERVNPANLTDLSISAALRTLEPPPYMTDLRENDLLAREEAEEEDSSENPSGMKPEHTAKEFHIQSRASPFSPRPAAHDDDDDADDDDGNEIRLDDCKPQPNIDKNGCGCSSSCHPQRRPRRCGLRVDFNRVIKVLW